MSTIVDKINKISGIKSACRDAIMEKKSLDEEDFPLNTPLSEYGQKLLTSTSGSLCDLEDLTINRNGEYKAKTGKAWSKVDVNVSLQTSSITITENGSYKATDEVFVNDDGMSPDAFTTIKVDVPTAGNTKLISKTVTDNNVSIVKDGESENIDGYSSIEVAVNLRNSKEIKVNGAFNIADEPYNEKKETIPYGYSQIVVNQNIKEKSITVPSSPFVWNVSDEKYTPTTKDEDKIQGYSHIHLISSPGEGPFIVRFMDGETVLYTTSVYRGGNASYSGTPPKKSGKYFCGWSPKPQKIQSDLDTYAVWSDTQKTYSNWKDIIEDGNSVPLGTTINLYVPGYSFLESYGVDINATGGVVTAIKVYSGEGGNSSTWIFPMPGGYSTVKTPHLITPTESITFDDTQDPEHLFKFCHFLNTKLRTLLPARNEGLIIRPTLKITETCILQTNQYVSRKVVSSMPYVWLVSPNEIKDDAIQCWMDDISGIYYHYSDSFVFNRVLRAVNITYNPNSSTENAVLYPILNANNNMSNAIVGFCTP